jgi:hypothetical protein
VAARSNAWDFGRALAGIVGSNPAGGMDVCLLWVVCCQIEVPATGRSLVQRSAIECGLSECDLEASKGGSLGPIWAVAPQERKGKESVKDIKSLTAAQELDIIKRLYKDERCRHIRPAFNCVIEGEKYLSPKGQS